MKVLMRSVLLIVMSGLGLWQYAMAQDSVRVIDNIIIKGKIRYHETIEPQTLRSEELEKVNAHTVADALRFMSGVQLKDYGGIGGLKTVNLRSLGSQHVGIYYDGIELGNAQNGVIDLGQFSLDNVEEISVYQGQRSAIMQTASDFANAGSLYIRTRRNLNLSGEHRQQVRIRLQTGASSLMRLSGLYERQLGERVQLSANVEGLSTNGRYRFNYRRRNLDGSIAYDTIATRQNGDVQSLRAELNLNGRIDDGQWNAKAYTYHSSRGIPGAIVNNVWKRGERQSDNNTFVQGAWQKDVSDIYTLRTLAKYANYRTHYINRDTTQLMVDNVYRLQEVYLSVVNVIELLPWWSVSANYDMRWNYLSADIVQFAEPTRWSHLGSLATALDLHQVQMQASIVVSHVKDRTKIGIDKAALAHWTPALFVSYSPTGWLQFTGFAKKSFRMPTFNDLYYTNIGNTLLVPESAIQYDCGVRLESHHTGLMGRLEMHAYHNSVHNKIVAYPKGQQFRWTMLNLGRVHIDGLDVQGNGTWQISRDLSLSTKIQYTYQRARDVTDKAASYYGDQIPYTPWHNGSATLMLDYGAWDLAYNFVYTGERYCQQENIHYNHLQPWYTSDLHMSWRHAFGDYRCKTTIEVNNLLDQQYDVIINYPMPGRNINVTLACEF